MIRTGVYVDSNRIGATLLATLLIFSVTPLVWAQTPRGQATAHVNLVSRLQEVQRNPKLADDTLKIGSKVAAVCANCHGDGGNSSKSDVPNLAGQNPAYLLEQLRKFADGQRKNAFMEGMIKTLKADEKIGIVLFYSGQSVARHASGVSAALVAKGKDYYDRICWRCHAADGHGDEKFARIAGQRPAYLSATLKSYRSGTGSRTDPLMGASTKLMSDADIDAMVAYVSSMP